MRRIQRSILRAHGRMLRRNGQFPARYLRSWANGIVGSEANQSIPGPGWKFKRVSVLGLSGKQEMRRKRARRRFARELIFSGGAL